MKRLLLPLLAALALPNAVHAETWILLQSFSGFTRSIDASSIVKNGFWRYANLRYKGPRGGSITGIKVNCKEEIYIYPMELTSSDLVFKRKSKDSWVIIEENFFTGEEYEKPVSMDKSGDGELSEEIYQFLCKEWE